MAAHQKRESISVVMAWLVALPMAGRKNATPLAICLLHLYNNRASMPEQQNDCRVTFEPAQSLFCKTLVDIRQMPRCDDAPVSAVVSWPPPWDAVEKNMLAALPARAPLVHRPPVASQKVLNCAAGEPYLQQKHKNFAETWAYLHFAFPKKIRDLTPTAGRPDFGRCWCSRTSAALTASAHRSGSRRTRSARAS